MSVFLSHKKENEKEALIIARYLEINNIQYYIDVFDPNIQDTDDITSLLLKRVRGCTHLMAIVSEYTEKSWWVPFEIGVASEIEKRITSFQLKSIKMPDFLSKWPIIKSMEDLEIFVKLYRQDSAVNLSERKYATASISNADQFHKKLKASLYQ